MITAVAAEAASSVGSNIFAVLSLLAIALLALLVIRHYLPLRSTPSYLLVPVFLALALPSSIIVLVPIDLASTQGNHGVWLPKRVILVTWRITYWLTFCLTWFILPLLGEYCDAGFRDTKSRMMYSFRTNLRYQLIMLATGIVCLVYIVLQNGFRADSIKGLVMALAYAWGLILAIGLMGHGLVALPRRVYLNASVSGRLKRLQANAPKIKDSLDEATDKLDELERTVLQLKRHKGGSSRAQGEWIDELAETSTLPESRPGMTAAIHATNPSIPAVVTDRYLADLTRKLKRARHRKARFVNEWTDLCQRARDTQEILDSASSKQLDFGRRRPGDGSLFGRMTVLTPTMRYHLHMNIIPYLRMALAGILAIASVLIVWSELVKSFAPKLSVIGLTVLHHSDAERGSKIDFGGQLIAAAWLLYMDTSALYAISDVKVWGNRALVRRQTYAESACWYSLQVAKLTVPLSYNFITMIPPEVYQETSFYKFLGQLINLIPLGQGFSRFFPCFLLIPMLATLFNLYGKAKNVFGFGVLEDESEGNPSGRGTGGWREGRALIERELQSGGVGGGANVGLSNRDASLDLERGISTPPTQRPRPREGPFRDEGIQDANRRFNAITNQEEPEDDSPRHFYQDFGERIRNTFDTAEQPEWMRNIGSAFKTPKWMQSDQRDDAGGSVLSRWLGGRPEDGRVRL
ncbi:LIMR family [Lecanosticta acicola]|uniref:LIMR family n=1 Tax=Lecanosticta acicola TaxID=111012 RepID=A0AAI8Z057_9PEZI|nr:LIMR family [Lecanosticta acicola]